MGKQHQVQPIANLRQRRARWKREVRDLVSDAFPAMLVAFLVVSWILGQSVEWGIGIDGVEPDALIFHFLNYSLIERTVMLLPIGLLLIIPLILSVAGRYPSKRDVLRDQELRRAFGMPDAVAPDVDD